MKVLDYFILIPTITAAWFGYQKGFLMAILQLLGLIIGLFLGFKMIDVGVEFIKLKLGYEGLLSPILGYLTMFLFIYISFIVISKVFKWVLHKTILGSFDKLAGLLLGILKVFLVVLMFIWTAQKYSFFVKVNWIKQNSVFCEYFIDKVQLFATN